MVRAGRANWFGFLGAAWVVFSAGGCGAKKADLPTTFAVRGTVTYEEDGKPMGGGSVQFEPIDGPTGSTAYIGTTQPDGRFEMHTVRDSTMATGVPEGNYRVRLTSPMGDDQQVQSVVLPGSYRVEPNGENVFKFAMPARTPPTE